MAGRKKTILIIDDDDNIRMLLEFVLRKQYHVVTREDGLSGISWLLAGNMPDLIIADLDMPRLNGYHFLKNIRESGFFYDIPLVMLSGYESNEIKIKCLEQGADDYWIKPFNPEHVFKNIKIFNRKSERRTEEGESIMKVGSSNISKTYSNHPEPQKKVKYDPIGEPLPLADINKILYVGVNGKKVCRKMVDLDYLGITLSTCFKAFCWLEKMSSSYSWSLKMGKPNEDLPDAIICDRDLPDADAYALHDRIITDPHLRRIPFIVISEDFSKEARLEALTKGVDDYYSVEVNPVNIHSRISFLKKFKEETIKLREEPVKMPEFRIPWNKRLFDIIISSLGLLITSPLFLVIAAIIKIQSRGPVFYISKRAGTGYKVFDFLKFRLHAVRCGEGIRRIDSPESICQRRKRHGLYLT